MSVMVEIKVWVETILLVFDICLFLSSPAGKGCMPRMVDLMRDFLLYQYFAEYSRQNRG